MELKELSDKWDKYAEAQEVSPQGGGRAHRQARKGRIVADVEAKLAKANEAMVTLEKEVKELTLKAQRPAVSSDKAEAAEAELKSFNLRAQAAAIEAGKSFTPLTAEQYGEYKAAMATTSARA
jgi:hypothetical protein